MIAGKLQVEEDLDCFIESETMSTTTESSFDNQGSRNRDKTQVEKKMKKLRSIKLSRIPSTRKGRSTSTQFRTKLSGYAASSEQSTPIEMSDASPNHINDTNLENFQVLPTTESGFKLLRSVTRKPSMKFRRPQMKKKSSKRDVNSQDTNKKHLQSSSSCSGSSFDNGDQDKNISANEKQQLAYPANKSIRVVRTPALGPMKILTKMPSLRSKRTKKNSEIPSIPDSNVDKDTCSSTLKSSKFRDNLEIKQGGKESDGTAALNVCRYSYCSLHGHRHGDKPPPLKRFVSMRRRAAKSQKSLKPDPKSSGKPKHSGNRKKGVESEKRVLNGDIGVADQQTTVDIREVPVDPMAASNCTDVARKKEMENQKNFTFWKLIYRQMATGLDAEPETQTPRRGKNSEEQAEDLLHAHENNDSCQENSRAGENHEAGNWKLEFSQSDAIKLVQQAFDKILSEIPDNSSDDRSIVSEKTSDHEFLLKQDEGKEVSISTSSNSIENCMVQDREKKKIQTDKELVPEEEKTAQKEGKRSDTQMPSSWSSLKKIIILRRFVKSLEKVRNLKPKTICYLPPAKDQEAEKIQLRPQTEKGKKNAEEWMLDLALRQVISSLAPSQKRKVAMLVHAFETVIPADNGDDMRSNVAASCPTTSVEAYNEFLIDNGDGTENQIASEMDFTAGHDQSSESNIAYQQLKKSSLDSKETSLLRSCKYKQLCTAGSEMSGTDMKKEDTGTEVMEEQTSAIVENEGSDLDSRILQPADPMADRNSTDVASKKDMENQKNFTFWKIIYRQMATGLDAEPETQTPCPGMNAEDLMNAHEKNGSCSEISRSDQTTIIEDHEASNRKLEFSQSDAIKLVQQAFDKILSEIPDNSSDDQSIFSEKTSDQEILLKQDEGKELSISTSTNSIGDCTVPDVEEMKLQTDKEIVSGKQMPSSWSYLKKIIILKRFVKSLEKVRNLKPKTIRYLPPTNDQEAENIQLRPQTEEGKKNGEEWMLDLALRQVISTLAPSQKRKVSMLVQAFETIIPAENGDDMKSNVAASSPTTSVEPYNELLVDNGDSTENLIGSEISPGKLLCKAGSEMNGTDMKKEDTGAVDDNNGNEVSIVDHSLSELEEPGLADKSLVDEVAIRTSHDKKLPVNEDVIQPISKEETSVYSTEVCNAGSKIGINKMDLASNDSSNSPDQQPDTPECLAEVGEGAQPKYKFLRTSLEQSESNFAPDISTSERQKYTRLWYLIYKHMVSDSAKENGSQPLADEEVQSNDASQCPMENNADRQASFAAGHSNEIIKLVEEAIDEIPLPEIQDNTSDNQSVIGDVIPDQEILEKKHGQEEVKIISISTHSKEKLPSSENVDAKMEAEERTEEGNKSKKRVQRNWSNLKKLVLLRRFVKALERVQEFNPRGPRFLPVDPAPESEKVLLRQQNIGDKKSAEEWMLDYALQQVVAKLTPERKRRVGLLVEAFETVIPTIS